jgi:hypothetical protein
MASKLWRCQINEAWFFKNQNLSHNFLKTNFTDIVNDITLLVQCLKTKIIFEILQLAKKRNTLLASTWFLLKVTYV